SLAQAGVAWWVLGRPATPSAPAAGPALPGLDARMEALEGIEVRGAGDTLLVSLRKVDGRWEEAGHPGWPSNEREISRALFRLAEARRVEPKTDDPALYARLGVEDIADAQAKSTELRLLGGGEPLRLVVGRNHPGLGGSYARLAGEARAWLLDADLSPARNPVDWLDRRIIDLPLARIERVRVEPARGRRFMLTRRDQAFLVDGQAPASAEDAVATAAVPEQLALDGVAADDGTDAERRHVFESVDGVALTIASWKGEGGTWARLSVSLDEEAALAWFARAGENADSPEQRLEALRGQVADWQSRFEGHRFLLPAQKAANLLRERADFLGAR
ncbi:DUF4340 domain-containing protein, partial [Arenimonas caeni]|uniref:DUF4340 domain-containing protein n=1 Tax=Arenimonas caeni TaxID=2058085 RepID=UPI002A367D70